MRRLILRIGLLFAVQSNVFHVLGQECAAGSAAFIAGNWYCQPVKAITYRNFPGSGDYDKVVGMDTITGQCQVERHEYSGSLSPLSEEVSPLASALTPIIPLPIFKCGEKRSIVISA